jgi:hypothetical protein
MVVARNVQVLNGHAADVRIAGVLRLAERFPRPAAEAGRQHPFVGFSGLGVGRQAEVGHLTSLAGPSGKGKNLVWRNEVVSFANGDQAAGLDEKPTRLVILGSGGLGLAVGTRELHHLTNLRHRKVESRLPQLLNQLSRPLQAVGVGSQMVVNGQAHCCRPYAPRKSTLGSRPRRECHCAKDHITSTPRMNPVAARHDRRVLAGVRSGGRTA